ncbi:cytochrome b6-f complex subunit PetL [Myxosarcina sp. GI1(2024)]
MTGVIYFTAIMILYTGIALGLYFGLRTFNII